MLSDLYASVFRRLRGKGLGLGLFNKVHSLFWQKWLRPEWVEVNGYRMRLPPDDTGFSQVLEMGEVFEPAVIAALRDVVKPGMTVLDVGANLGYHTLLASKLVGPAGKVVAVEPEATNLEYLALNLKENACANVTVLPYAAGEAASSMTLYLSPSSRSGHSLLPTDGGTKTQTVEVAALDDVVPPALQPDVVKMDIEGAEAMALRGMKRLVADPRLKAIVIECNPDHLSKQGTTAERFLQGLRGSGFVFTALDRDNWLGRRA